MCWKKPVLIQKNWIDCASCWRGASDRDDRGLSFQCSRAERDRPNVSASDRGHSGGGDPHRHLRRFAVERGSAAEFRRAIRSLVLRIDGYCGSALVWRFIVVAYEQPSREQLRLSHYTAGILGALRCVRLGSDSSLVFARGRARPVASACPPQKLPPG